MLLNALLPTFILLMGALVIAGAFISTPNPGAELERRMQRVAETTTHQKVAEQKTEETSEQGERFNKRVRGFFAVGSKLSWGMHSGGLKLLLVAALAGMSVWMFTLRAVELGWWISVSVGVVAAFFLPRMLLMREQRKAEAQFLDMFPDAVDTIVRMLRVGLPMSSSVRVVGVEGSPPVSTIFTTVADQIKIGIPLEEALDASSQLIGLPDYRFFAVTVLLQYTTGGNIASTLDVLAAVIRKRRAVRLKASSATAEIRLTAYVLGSLPFLTMGVLLLMQPGYLKPLFNDPRGHVILGIAAGGLLASFLSMRMMLRSVTKG